MFLLQLSQFSHILRFYNVLHNVSTSQIPLPFAFPPVCYDFHHLIVSSCFSSFDAFMESHTFAIPCDVSHHILHFTDCTTIQKSLIMFIPTSPTLSQHVTPFAHFTNYIDSLFLTAFRGRSQFSQRFTVFTMLSSSTFLTCSTFVNHLPPPAAQGVKSL